MPSSSKRPTKEGGTFGLRPSFLDDDPRDIMHIDPSNEDLIHVRVQKRSQLEDQLDTAVNILAERAALCGGKGILVARHSPRDFTVQLHPSVPFGIIREWQE